MTTALLRYDRTEYGEIINGPQTFAALAEDLSQGPVMIDWNDGRSSLLNVCFARPTRIRCPFGGGQLDERSGLVVAVMGFGSFMFCQQTDYPYVAEKLKVTGGTAEGLAKLINALVAA